MATSDELTQLEAFSRQLVLDDDDERRRVGSDVLEYVNNFWANVPQYKPFERDLDSSEKIFNLQIEDNGKSLKEILELFDESVIHNGIQCASGGNMGYIPSGGLTLSALGDFVAAATNKYIGVHTACPGGVNIENHILSWAASLFGFDKKRFGGNLCTGGSTGNLMCIATARDKHNISGRDYHRVVTYASEQVHFCTEKALKVLGMRETVLRKIQVDKNYNIDTSILEETIESDVRGGLEPFLIVGTAGSTACGAIDDVKELSVIAKKYGCWLHVDAAYGGFFYILDEMKNKFKGIEQVDSLVLDLHKSLFLPFGSGIVLVKEHEDLLRTFSYSSELIDNSDNRNQSPADLSIELTKNFRGLRAWFPFLYHGLDTFRGALREKIMLTRYAYGKMKALNYLEVGPTPQLTVFIFRFHPHGTQSNKHNEDLNIFNKKMNAAFREDGRAFLTNTEINGVYWMRVAVLCIRTHQKDIDAMIDMIQFQFEKHNE